MLGILFVAAFASFVVQDIKIRIDVGRARAWSSTPGHLTQARWELRRNFKTWGRELRIAYDFVVDGVQYRGHRHAVGIPTTEPDFEEILSVGDPITIWYDPQDPTQNAVEVGCAANSMDFSA
jgi:hypothetical protein